MSDEPEYLFYHYEPSIPAAIIFAVAFCISAIIHAWQMFRYRTFYFLPLVIAALLEGVGYIVRVLSAQSPTSLPPYVVTEITILVAPALMAASIYIILGRIIYFVKGEHHAIIPVHRITKMFVSVDVVAFLLQVGGGGLLATPNPDIAKIGEYVVIAGLLAQIVWFSFFVVVSFIFHRRIINKPTPHSTRGRLNPSGRFSWLLLLKVLYIASGFILVRSIFRVIEYIQGREGYLQTHEAFYFCLDALQMLPVVVVFNVVHPGLVLLDDRNDKDHENAVGSEAYPMRLTQSP